MPHRRTLAWLLLATLFVGLPALAEETEDPPEWDVSNPPGEWTTVPLDVEESTWSNVALSPDGQTVYFDLLGDIYRMPIGGGEAEPIAHGIEWNMQPAVSPDGSTIAFISDRKQGDNIWLMDADGSNPRQITEETYGLVYDPAWSPDGEMLVARKGYMSTRSKAAGEVWMFHRSGGDGLILVERPYGEDDQKDRGEAVYSPDGRYVYYTDDMTSGQRWQYNKDSVGQIFAIKRLELETGETEVLVGGAGGAIRPTPSPDGKFLAFVRRIDFQSHLFLMDLSNGREWSIYDALDRDLQETSGNQALFSRMAWTPDSREIVFWAGGKIRRLDVETREHEVIPFRVRTEKKVRPALRFAVDVAPDTFDARLLRWITVSPDGSRVVFQSLGYLWTRALPDGEPKRLTKQEDHFEFYPAFSRDGKSIVYTTWDDQDLGTVRVVGAGGGSGKVLTDEPGHYLEPTFSPDGKTVVYRKTDGGFLLESDWGLDPGLYRVDAQGKESPERFHDDGFEPQFGAAGDRVYFTDNGQDTESLFKSIALDGSDERTHLKGAKAIEYAISPDGKWVGFVEQFRAYITPLVATGKPVSVSSGMSSIPVQKVSKWAGMDLHWSGDAKTMHWSVGPELFSRSLEEAFAFVPGAPEELPDPPAEGIDLSFPVDADKPSGVIALTGAKILTMRGDEVIEEGTVLIRDNRIEAVGADVAVPEGAFLLDCSGQTIIPGLVDVHAHGSHASEEITPQQNWRHYSSLAFGVTTIHDPSNDTTEIFASAEMIRAGVIVGPRTYSTGTILYGAYVPGYTAKIDSYEDAEFHVRRMASAGAISVKSYNQPRREQRQQVIEAASKQGIMVFPEGGAKFQHNMNMIVDGHTGVEHALPIADIYEDVLQFWSQTEVGYTPTLGVAYGGLSGENYWYDRTEVWNNERLLRYTPSFLVDPAAIRRTTAPDHHYNHIRVAAHCKQLLDRGVSIQNGAHGQREGLAAHWELWMLEQGGMTPLEALRSSTLAGAWYIGMDQELGSIEPGKLADLVVVDGDLLTDLRRSEYVTWTVINGRVYEAATMDQIAPDAAPREPFWWEDGQSRPFLVPSGSHH